MIFLHAKTAKIVFSDRFLNTSQKKPFSKKMSGKLTCSGHYTTTGTHRCIYAVWSQMSIFLQIMVWGIHSLGINAQHICRCVAYNYFGHILFVIAQIFRKFAAYMLCVIPICIIKIYNSIRDIVSVAKQTIMQWNYSICLRYS
jgi:hypothetical protein